MSHRPAAIIVQQARTDPVSSVRLLCVPSNAVVKFREITLLGYWKGTTSPPLSSAVEPCLGDGDGSIILNVLDRTVRLGRRVLVEAAALPGRRKGGWCLATTSCTGDGDESGGARLSLTTAAAASRAACLSSSACLAAAARARDASRSRSVAIRRFGESSGGQVESLRWSQHLPSAAAACASQNLCVGSHTR